MDNDTTTAHAEDAAILAGYKEPTMTAKTLQIITNVEHQSEDGYTRAWIVPTGTDTAADLELESVDHVDIPATESESEWLQCLLATLADSGYAIDGQIVRAGAVITATVTRAA